MVACKFGGREKGRWRCHRVNEEQDFAVESNPRLLRDSVPRDPGAAAFTQRQHPHLRGDSDPREGAIWGGLATSANRAPVRKTRLAQHAGEQKARTATPCTSATGNVRKVVTWHASPASKKKGGLSDLVAMKLGIAGSATPGRRGVCLNQAAESQKL